ncbi:MAG: chromate transporter [Bacilli bacterium]|jgi:chromate transporter|nr:chromate transporter [Bacilli bacterium]
MILLVLLWVYIKVGLFSFGGLAAIPLIQQEVVNHQHWIDYNTFIHMITISQMTPGPIGINIATFTGYQLSGLVGAIFATLGFVLPSLIIMSIVSILYFKYNNLSIVELIFKGIRPVVVAMISGIGLIFLFNSITIKDNFNYNGINYWQIILFILAMIAIYKFKLSPIKLISLFIIINVFIFSILMFI